VELDLAGHTAELRRASVAPFHLICIQELRAVCELFMSSRAGVAHGIEQSPKSKGMSYYACRREPLSCVRHAETELKSTDGF
jgi:hypothetical protein